MLKILKGGSTMREVQDPKRDMMNTMNVIDASARAAGAVASAIGYYIETRALQDNNAKTLYNYMKKGGQLKMMECEEKETLRSLMKSCDKLGIAYKECVFDRNGKESYGVIFADKNEDAMKQLRTDYLVANHKLFQVDQDTIRRFNAQQEPEKISGLDFAEMSYMKDRAAKNYMLFAAEREKDGRYSIYLRTEDKRIFDSFHAGVMQERNGTGKAVYDYMNIQRKNKEDIVNLVHAANGSKFYISNDWMLSTAFPQAESYASSGTAFVILMDEVMSSPEEEKLQDEILTLIKKSGVQGIDSATYLKDQTVELNEDDTCLYFRLSDGSTLPVCYRKSSDKFYLGYTEVPKKGEEKNLLSDDAYLRNEGGSK